MFSPGEGLKIGPRGVERLIVCLGAGEGLEGWREACVKGDIGLFGATYIYVHWNRIALLNINSR